MSNHLATTSRSDEEIEAIASSCLQAAGLPAWTPVLELIEAAAKKFKASYGLIIEEVLDGSLDSDEARATSSPPKIRVVARVLAAARRNEPRARFTVAHEFGHIILGHQGGERARSSGPQTIHQHIRPFEDAEHQANVFGAAFLIPLADADLALPVGELQIKFRVSKQAVEVRLARARTKKPRPAPAEVIAFLAARRQQESRGRASSNAPRITAEQEAWNQAAYAPGENPSEYRLCIRGRLVRRDHHMKRRSVFGWCVRDGLVCSYAELGITGEARDITYQEAPCPHCGHFTVRKTAGYSRCDTCGSTGTSGGL